MSQDEGQGRAEALAKAELLYAEIDEIARDFDSYDYGLPYDDTWRARAIALITAALRAERVKALEEAAKEFDVLYKKENISTIQYNGGPVFDDTMAAHNGNCARLRCAFNEWIEQQARRAGEA